MKFVVRIFHFVEVVHTYVMSIASCLYLEVVVPLTVVGNHVSTRLDRPTSTRNKTMRKRLLQCI